MSVVCVDTSGRPLSCQMFYFLSSSGGSGPQTALQCWSRYGSVSSIVYPTEIKTRLLDEQNKCCNYCISLTSFKALSECLYENMTVKPFELGSRFSHRWTKRNRTALLIFLLCTHLLSC